MGIRARAAAYVAMTMIILAVLLLVLASSTITATFDHLERRDGERGVKLVQSWMLGQSQEQARNAQSYGAWSATYKFIENHGRGYIAENMSSANLASIRADFFVFVDAQGRIVYSKFVRRQTLRTEVLAYVRQARDLQAFDTTLSVKNDIASLPDVVVAVGTSPIVTSQSKGPIRGTLVSGRFLDGTAEKDVSSQIGENVAWNPIRLQPLGESDYQRLLDGHGPLLESAGGEHVGWGLVRSERDSAPIAVVKVPIDPSIAAEGASLSRDADFGLALFIVVSILALVVVLDTSMLRRLLALTRRVRHIGAAEDPGQRVEVNGRDEVGRLATDINSMLEAIDHSRAQLVDMATHDPLTGLFNRRRFDEELARELSESKRFQRGGALLWFDLDDFKKVNDTHGHAVGDEVLVSFAELLKSESRAYSALARFGGDEFVMLAGRIGAADPAEPFERVRAALAAQPIPTRAGEVPVTISFGVTVWLEGDTEDQMVARADEALYRAKSEGRDRVCVAGAAGS